MTADKAALLELRDRVKAATGPDRKLDADLHAYFTGRITHKNLPVGYTMVPGGNHRLATAPYIFKGRGPAPHYTGSLDAAVGLVPEGFNWSLPNVNPTLASATLIDINGYTRISIAATPALALCLARLEYEIAKVTDHA